MKSPDNNPIENEIRGPQMAYPNSTIHDLFTEQSEIHPNSIALEFEDKQVSYAELNTIANQMANYFWSQGLRPGQIVAVSLDRTPELTASLFAILKCGAAYLPLDSKFPTTRLEFMLEDSEANFLLTSKSISTSLPNHSKMIWIEDLLSVLDQHSSLPISVAVSNEAVIYIIYTSGSTGKPKGVTVTHKNLVNFLSSMSAEPGINRNDKLASITTISFDISGLELFLPLLEGATVVFVDYETTRDGQLLLDFIQNKGITILQATPTTWQLLLDSGWENPLTLKALCGGEAMPLNLARKLISRCDSLWNMYGPTETTIWSAVKQIQADDELITIGFPIANTQIYLLDEVGQAVASGSIGEIVIGGDGVAQGYWKRAELTAEKFIPNQFSTKPNSIMYRTGDLGKLLPNGELQCLGRIDHQVKIRGHRIELGEIEATLNSIDGIIQSAVIVSDYLGNEAKIIAYLKSSELSKDEKQIHNALSKILPEILLPSRYIWIDEFPITPNGKIDKKNLPLPEYVRPDSAPLLRKPRTAIEKEIAKVWIEELKLPVVGIDDNFFEMGGTSILTQRIVTILRKCLSENISVSNLYRYPTIATLSEYLAVQNKSQNVIDYSKREDEKSSSDVAIIGMAGRFPGAASVGELWDILKEGKETISFFKSEEIDVSIPESIRNNPLYVGARGIIQNANTFDAAFFGINPKLAEVMDPQQRLFLEISWEALEQKGYLPKHYNGRIGVYAGTGTNTYYKKNILPDNEILDQIGYFQAETVNDKDYIATRTAYHLNIKGPAVSIHSACSTSLLAIAQAVQAIRNGQCDIALAGASSVTAPIFSGHLYEEGSMLSADGHCRAFDAAGKGTVFSDGAGVVLLKSLASAINDGDKIYGIIKGIGISNDGGNKGSFTAPSAEGQAAAISEALFDAKVTPDSISYVETHGTATPIGDPIEIEGLKIAYGKQSKNGYCAIGSIKTNMGHLTAAAGVAGLIKTILAMNNKLIPASLGFEKPNPAIDFENSPFFVNAKLRNWDSDAPLRAGVSSFGVGGTNVHLIVEEYPTEQKVSSSSRPLQILMWSAKSENSLKGYATELGKFLQSKPDSLLADVAYSLNKTRDTFIHRNFLLSSNCVDASQEILSNEKNTIKTSILKVAPNELVFLFPGQGSQFSQMGINLYKNEIIFKEAVDICAEFLLEELKLDIREILYPEIVTPEAEAKLKDTRFTQPALFVTEYALSQLWLSWGIKPTAFCGHSIGEFVAAHLAGIFNLQDALHLIATRGRLVSELPGGSMLSVRLSEDKLKNILPDTLSIAAINSNAICVVSGEDEKVNEFAKSLEQMEIANKLLFTSHAFHSKMMDPILDSFEKEVKKIHLNKPFLPIVSTVTGTWLLEEEAIDPKYWTNHLRKTVRFSDAANTLLKLEDIMFLEVGPGQTLTTLTKQQGTGKIIPAFTSLLLPKNQETEYHSLLGTLGELWLRGIDPDWNAFYHQQQRLKIDLPSYVFDRKLCWIEPINTIEIKAANKNTVTDVPLFTTSTDSNSTKTKDSRKDVILLKISETIKNVSGIIYEFDTVSTTFLELGLDSLALTQLAGRLKKEFDLPITFRQLNEAFSSPSLLSDYIVTNTPEQDLSNHTKEEEMILDKNNESFSLKNNIPLSSNQNQISLEQIVQQIQLLSQKIDLLQNHQNNSTNETFSISGLKTEPQVSIELKNENQIEKNGVVKQEKKQKIIADESPVPGARLGRDEDGNPAWFIEDSSKNGGYIKINL
ncbi:amino acid adenylation domain-containing protein [Flavobacterium franklandianum]|uniref:polyketide synthase n=1 Tax=Flavobacterium franklandianum TaxID=2594430 RepID=UPI00117A4DFE|nr:polyketide synthase [Flavobacterium franklandianum]TRX27556.1 amino acid adenylation domain-containing protein [Flavobacterium franklandianum]